VLLFLKAALLSCTRH